jgi:hypothetical protein
MRAIPLAEALGKSLDLQHARLLSAGEAHCRNIAP